MNNRLFFRNLLEIYQVTDQSQTKPKTDRSLLGSIPYLLFSLLRSSRIYIELKRRINGVLSYSFILNVPHTAPALKSKIFSKKLLQVLKTNSNFSELKKTHPFTFPILSFFDLTRFHLPIKFIRIVSFPDEDKT